MDSKTCSNGECLDVDASNGAAARQTQIHIKSGEWIAQTFEIAKGGTFVEVRVNFQCPKILAKVFAVDSSGSPKDQVAEVIQTESRDPSLQTALRVGHELAVGDGERLALQLGLAFPSDDSVQTCVIGATTDDNYRAGQMLTLNTSTLIWETAAPTIDLDFKVVIAR